MLTQRLHDTFCGMPIAIGRYTPSHGFVRGFIIQQALRLFDDAFKQSLVGTTQRVLIERPSRRGGGQMTGKTSSNRSVNFDAPASMAGQFVDVAITEMTTNSLRGRLVSKSPSPPAARDPLPHAGEGRNIGRSPLPRAGEGGASAPGEGS